MEAVARQAGVTRQTVHNQFGSRVGLLGALCDSAALDGGLLIRLPEVFGQADPLKGLETFVEALVGFWAVDGGLIVRMNALAALDPELGEVLGERQDRRRRALEELVARLGQQHELPRGLTAQDTVDMLLVLTSFDTFEALARLGRRPAEIARIVVHLAVAALRTAA